MLIINLSFYNVSRLWVNTKKEIQQCDYLRVRNIRLALKK
jgi:hypothetical protein